MHDLPRARQTVFRARKIIIYEGLCSMEIFSKKVLHWKSVHSNTDLSMRYLILE